MTEEKEREGFLEKLLDNPIALLVISCAIFVVLYLLWGVLLVVSIPPMPASLKELILGGVR